MNLNILRYNQLLIRWLIHFKPVVIDLINISRRMNSISKISWVDTISIFPSFKDMFFLTNVHETRKIFTVFKFIW